MNFKQLLLLSLVLCLSFVAIGQGNNQYFRHLKYNHVSPYVKLAGTYPISELEASATSHYVFTYNKKNQLISITNNHYFTERRHPLASIGAYKTLITYQGNQETRIFLDIKGDRVSNDRGVYKEVFTLNQSGDYIQLEFFDLEDEPMGSNWNISKYTWNKAKKMVVENRVNLNNEPQSLSTYFDFGTTGMTFKDDGTPIGNYNLNSSLEITNNEAGVASYQDEYDEFGNHVKYSYYDKANKLVNNANGFAVGVKVYDSIGNYIKQQIFDADKKLLREREIANNQYVKLSDIASKEDSLEIKRISLGYLKALQELKPELMKEVMNDSLNKVTVGFNRSIRKEVVTAISRDRMIENAENWNKSNTKFPPNPNNEVIILDVYHRMATVKLFSDNWVEYLHLIKLDGKWSIINLLWQHKNVKRYPF